MVVWPRDVASPMSHGNFAWAQRMSLVGNIEDLPLTDILQIVSLSRKSGVLALKREGAEAAICFQNGLVVAASITDFPLDLLAFLRRKGLLTPADEADVRQQVQDGIPVAEALANFAVPDTVIEGFSRAAIEKVVYRLFTWREGSFTFDLMDGAEERFRANPLHPFLAQGVNPQFLAMEGARLQDESDYFTTKSPGAAPSPDPAPAPAAKPEPRPAQAAPSEPPVAPAPPPAQPARAAAPATAPATASGAASSAAPRPSAAAAPAPALNDRPLVAIVDNDAVALKNIENVLLQRGYEVAAFARVETVINAVRELLRKGRPLIVLADLVMPKRDASGMLGGLEVLELLRAEEQDVPIVVLADINNADAEARARELGADGYVSKPGRKFYVKEKENNTPEFLTFMAGLAAEIERLTEKARGISASPAASPFVDLSTELKGELEAATHAVSATAPVMVPGIEKSRGLDMLKEMVRELNDPHFNADVSLLVLRFAVELMDRAVIFAVTPQEVIGLGQAGIDAPDATARVRSMRVPLAGSSIFSDVVRMNGAVRRKLDSSEWNRYILDQLGGQRPEESFAAPIFTSRRMAAVVYGDNASSGRPIGDVDALEIFLSHAGIAMERALLERRLRDLTGSQRIHYAD